MTGKPYRHFLSGVTKKAYEEEQVYEENIIDHLSVYRYNDDEQLWHKHQS
jgi:hypothetical protein